MWTKRVSVVAVVGSILVAACSGSGGTEPTVAITPVTVTTTTTTLPPPTEPQVTVAGLLDRLVAAINGGDAGAAFDLFAPNAIWAVDGVQIRLDEPVSGDASFIAGLLGLPERAAGSDVVRAMLVLQVTLRTRPEATRCRIVASAASCDYAAADAISDVSGAVMAGRLTVQADGHFITHYELETTAIGRPGPDYDAFLRWAAIRDANVTRAGPLPELLGLRVELIDEWEAAGRPDVARPDEVGDDPVAVVAAFFAARNEGDWETLVALMSASALDDPFGSRDEFDAAQLLDRVVTVSDCEVVLESPTLGSRVGCDVEVTDIIVAAAGVTATNPNQSTLQVAGGRVTELPEFIPSSFQAESAIEAWAVANEAAAYAAACPDGIAGQSPIEGLACARFIAEHRDGWTEAVAALDLG